MPCYNCGYKTSVVSKDDIGWLCEWCSDNELRSPIVERLKKRIKEIKKLLQNTRLDKDESMELQYWLRENTMALGEGNE